MKTLAIILSYALLAGAGAALAGAPLNPPRIYTGVFQPKGTAAKASSFAPHSANKRRAYGAPVQSPLFKRQPVRSPKLTTAQLPKP